jgi:ribosomal protein L16 Arg81 hydroxylase
VTTGRKPVASEAAAEASSPDLQWLVAPLEAERFEAEYYEKQVCVVRRGQPDYYADLLTLADLDEVLGTHAPRHPDVSVVQVGREIVAGDFVDRDGRIDPMRVGKLFAEGATVIFSRLDRSLPRLSSLCSFLCRTFTSRMQTNIYLTPPDSQGFAPHWDTHDVFVLQASGTKIWTIYDCPVRLPLRGQDFDPKLHKPGDPTMEFTVEPGDMVYIPRGVYHSARSTGETSLHLTTGLIAFTWTDVLLHAVTSAAENDVALRENLPMGTLTGAARADRDALLRERLARLSELAATLPPWEFLQNEVIAHWEPCLTDMLSQVESARDLELDARLRVRRGAVWAYQRGDDDCVLQWQGRKIRFPAFTAPSLDFVLERPSFRVRDIPGDLDDPGRLTLVRRLLREGFLQCLSSDESPSSSS